MNVFLETRELRLVWLAFDGKREVVPQVDAGLFFQCRPESQPETNFNRHYFRHDPYLSLDYPFDRSSRSGRHLLHSLAFDIVEKSSNVEYQCDFAIA